MKYLIIFVFLSLKGFTQDWDFYRTYEASEHYDTISHTYRLMVKESGESFKCHVFFDKKRHSIILLDSVEMEYEEHIIVANEFKDGHLKYQVEGDMMIDFHYQNGYHIMDKVAALYIIRRKHKGPEKPVK